MLHFFEIRFYTTGWTINIGPFYIGVNNQRPAYWEFRIGKLKTARPQGGFTWKEHKLAEKQRREAKEKAKSEAEELKNKVVVESAE